MQRTLVNVLEKEVFSDFFHFVHSQSWSRRVFLLNLFISYFNLFLLSLSYSCRMSFYFARVLPPVCNAVLTNFGNLRIPLTSQCSPFEAFLFWHRLSANLLKGFRINFLPLVLYLLVKFLFFRIPLSEFISVLLLFFFILEYFICYVIVIISFFFFCRRVYYAISCGVCFYY